VALDRPANPPDDAPDTPRSPEERADPWGVESLTRAQAFESLKAKADQLDGTGRGSYWSEVSRFVGEWRDHVGRWPRYSSSDREEHAPGSQPDHVDAAAEQVSRAEVGISSDIERVAGDCAQPTWLGGFEFRLKDADRIKEKVADKLIAEPDRSPAEIVQAIPDAIRYTFCFQAETYVSGFENIKGKLEASGYEMYYIKNYWLNSEYKGVNSRWITAEGQRFEVQFHTAESFHAKHEVTHPAYERIRDSRTSGHERGELRGFQCEVSRFIPVPVGACDILDYKKEVL
jgi:hypothetical protein